MFGICFIPSLISFSPNTEFMAFEPMFSPNFVDFILVHDQSERPVILSYLAAKDVPFGKVTFNEAARCLSTIFCHIGYVFYHKKKF